MSVALLIGIAGLAVLDSFNPATIVAVTLILLGSRRRPLREALSFVLGAFASVFIVGTVIFLGAGAAAESFEDGLQWLRRGAFGFAALVLFASAIKALRPRQRKAIGLPSWFNAISAVGLGVIMTAADLPNAFPYFIAIERLVKADPSTGAGLLVLAGYGVIYCLPCLILLAIGLTRGAKVRARLERLHNRFGTATQVPASKKKAAALAVASMAVAAIAATS